jgi:hypothetical protein
LRENLLDVSPRLDIVSIRETSRGPRLFIALDDKRAGGFTKLIRVSGEDS